MNIQALFSKYGKFAFPAMCGIALVLTFMVGGVVLGGILMGIVSTIAIWMSIQRFPEWLKNIMCMNTFTVFLTDIAFLKLTAAVMMLLGSGVTVFVAIITQMVLLGLLIDNMKHQKDEEKNGKLTVVESEYSYA